MVLVNFSWIHKNIFFFHITRRCSSPSSSSSPEKKRTGVLGGMSETNYWQSHGNSYPITRALSLPALWENQPPPHPNNRKKRSSFLNSEWISSYVCMFALNEGTTTRKSPPLSVCKGLAALRTERRGRGLMIKFWITLGKQADLFAVCVPWWEHTPKGFYQPLRAQFKWGRMGRTFPTQ